MLCRRRWRWRVIGAVVITVLVFGCGGIGPVAKSEIGGGPGDDGEGVERVPIRTTWFAAGTTAGTVVYRTNDPSRTGVRGGSDWHMGTVRQEPMSSVEVEVSKRSGDAQMGYGVTFAMRDIDTFMVMMITTTRRYQIGRVVERGYTALTGWTFSPLLAGGYGRPNRLRVEYDGEADRFTAFINGTEVKKVRNDGGIRLSGGGFGHLVSLSPNERFPEVAVHVEFRQITPRAIGLVTGGGERPAVRGLGAWR